MESLTKTDILGSRDEIISAWPLTTEKDATISHKAASSPHCINTEDSSPVKEIHQTRKIEKPEKAFLRPPRRVCSSAELSVNACCAPHVALKRPTSKRMGLSKSNRIIVLLVIDSAFFLVELVVGMDSYSCHLAATTLIRVPRLCRPLTRPRCRLLSYGRFPLKYTLGTF
jgi:hypothetical protein